MRHVSTLPIAIAFYVAPLSFARAEAPVEQWLVLTDTGDAFRLSVPVSQLVMTIPRGDLAVVRDSGSGGTASPRYFHLEDTGRGIIISGWFEPAQLYHGIKQFWKGEVDSYKKNRLPIPREESFQTVERWDAVLYDLKAPSGSNTHIRAEWVQADTWIDVHISVTTREPIDKARSTAMDVLREIRITSAP